MQQRSKFIQRTSALALAAVLALGMGVQAAGPSTSTVDDRREDLTIFYETLKDSHPDLFANTPEETFLATLDAMVEQAFDDQCTGANPRYPLMREIKQMYLNAYYGKHEEV